MSRPIISPSLVVLVGAPASGKSTWAAENFTAQQIVSSDQLRCVVGEHELDLAATDDVFDLIDRIVAMRLGRSLTTVIDTTGLDAKKRKAWLALAQDHGVNTVAVRFTTPAAECKRRNRERQHPVPAKALDTMLRSARNIDLDDEGWDEVLQPEPVRTVTPKLAASLTEPDDVATESIAPPRLKFGLLVSTFDWPGGPEAIAPTLSSIATDAEQAGFDSLWLMDHLHQIPQIGRAWDPMLETYTSLAHSAAATSTLRIGALVSPVTLRQVGLLAKTVATLDVLSGGRMIAGVGAGNYQPEHRAVGVDFPAASRRLTLLEDALQALPRFWGPGGKPFKGKILEFPDTSSYPRPIQDPVPLIVGGSGEKVTLRLAAHYGSGCNLFGDAETVARKVAVLHGHCEAVGRDPGEVEVTHLGQVLVGANAADLRLRIERLRPSNQGLDRYASAVNAGTVDDHEAGFGALAAAGVQTAILSTPGLVDPAAFEPLAELLARFS